HSRKLYAVRRTITIAQVRPTQTIRRIRADQEQGDCGLSCGTRYPAGVGNRQRRGGQFLLQVLPVAVETIGMAGRRLWRLGLEPSDGSIALVIEGVHAPDTRPQDVAGAQHVLHSICDGFHIPTSEEHTSEL